MNLLFALDLFFSAVEKVVEPKVLHKNTLTAFGILDGMPNH